MPSKTPAATHPTPPKSFETALSEINLIVSNIESGTMPLAQLLSAYQRGAILLSYCKDQLTEVEHQVQLLENGETTPWKP